MFCAAVRLLLTVSPLQVEGIFLPLVMTDSLASWGLHDVLCIGNTSSGHSN
jgi:hypothetical protein